MSLDILDPRAFERGVRDVVGRGHNLPEEMRREAVGDYISEAFDAATAKCAEYLLGSQIFEDPSRDGWFNALSLGNWLMIADRADVPYIPARFLCSPRTLLLFTLFQGMALPDAQHAEADEFLAAIQGIKPGEMFRLDMCASASVKAGLSDGRGVQPGWHEADGVKFPDVDGRIVHALLNYTFERLPVFARPIVPLRMVEADIADAPFGRWPREWRCYVSEGRVTGVSNYYLQAPAKRSEAPMAEAAAALAQRMVDALAEARSWPHHPRYEGVFSMESVHCSLDFAETEDGRLLLVEGGPAHIFDPPWGAHPCCFTPGKPIEGIALALGSAPLSLAA